MADNNIRELGEVLDDVARSFEEIDESNWGPWKLDRSNRQVYIAIKPASYRVDISDLEGPAAFFSTFRQLTQKTWADNECMGGLARAAFAISDALGDPVHRNG